MENGTELRVLGGKYRLVRKLESGGMGSVWYAEHLILSSPVAIKLLELEDQNGGAALPRFLREAQMAASLRSPHVVQILDYGVDEQTPFIVMELLVGESLAARLRRQTRLSPRETGAIVTQIARAVGRAHDAGIVHRDLKPANVFVVRDADVEVVKVLDFGIAKAQASADGNTQSGTFLGTPLYASPEQTQGVRALDHRTDIWSLGVIAFECLLGLRPFGGDTFGAIVLAVCVKPLPVPSTCGAVPLGFDEWFAKACARDPEQRFSSARQAAEALAKICAGELVANLGSTQSFPLAAHASASSLAHAATAPELDESNVTHRASSISREPELTSGGGRTRWRWAAALGVLSSALVALFFLRKASEDPRATTVTSLSAPAPLAEGDPPASPASTLADAGARPVTTPSATTATRATTTATATTPDATTRVTTATTRARTAATPNATTRTATATRATPRAPTTPNATTPNATTPPEPRKRTRPRASKPAQPTPPTPAPREPEPEIDLGL